MEELSELSESMRQAASLLADDDPSNDAAPRCPSTFLNAVTLGNVGAGKSAVLNSLIGHPVLPTGENGATRAPIVVDLQRDPGLSSKSIVLQIDSKSQQVSASALRHSLQDRLSKGASSGSGGILLSMGSQHPKKPIALSAIILGLVMVGRAAFVFPLSFISNLSKKESRPKISFKQQVIIWWAGLMRGAVSIALAYNKFTASGHTELRINAIMITSTVIVVLFSTMASRLFGLSDELNEDALLGRLEGMKDVIEQVNRQFKDPDLTTFVCVCIPEFLSLYETERLVQELAKFEIDAHNIIINQVLFDEEAVESKLLKARIKMQQKYIDQFHMLYDDFNITKLPLLPEEVCGVQALQNFSRHFLTPYKPALKRGTVEELEQRISVLKSALQEAEPELDRLRKGKQIA